MAGFLTHYLFGMESCEKLPDNYIKEVIIRENHSFLTGLQGFNLLSFDPMKSPRRGLSYRTDTGVKGQEYGALFHNMLDYIEGLQGHSRDTCLAFMAGFLCYFTLSESATPYISYFAPQGRPSPRRVRDRKIAVNEIQVQLDTVLFRTHCHMEPSQLNFEALTFVSRKDLTQIEKLMRYSIQAAFHRKISSSEIANGLRALRRRIICLRPGSGFRRMWIGNAQKALPLPIRHISTDFQADTHDYMNAEGRPWYPYPGCSRALHTGFDVIFEESLRDSIRFLEDLDSCISWGMSRDGLIGDIISYAPYQSV